MKQKNIYDFQQFETIRSFCDNIYTDKITINETERNQSNLFQKIWQNIMINLDQDKKKVREKILMKV